MTSLRTNTNTLNSAKPRILFTGRDGYMKDRNRNVEIEMLKKRSPFIQKEIYELRLTASIKKIQQKLISEFGYYFVVDTF